MSPRAGGQYAFARGALGDYAGFVVGCSDWLATCGSTAAAALVIGEYLALLVSRLHGAATILAVAVPPVFPPLPIRGLRRAGPVPEGARPLKTLSFALLVTPCLPLRPRLTH